MSEAQKEAERRWPSASYGSFSQVKNELNVARRAGFVNGAEYERTREVTDAEVEAAAKALSGAPFPSARSRARARAALKAAREVQA